MKTKLKTLFVTILFSCSAIAQNPNLKVDKTNIKLDTGPSNYELGKMVTELQKANSRLQDQVDALQKQVNLNYKAQDYMMGLIVKKTDELKGKSEKTAAFVVTASSSNLADAFSPPTNTVPGTYYRSVIVDNPASNGHPEAILIVVPQRSGFGYNLPAPVALDYDKSINKWKIFINPHETNDMIVGKASPYKGSMYVSVLEYYPYQILTGDKFNVEVIIP